MEKNKIDDITSEISFVLAEETCSERITRFFHEIFTESEIVNLAKRWELMKLLLKGNSQRDIAAELGVSLCKITRGSRLLKQDCVTRQWMKRMLRNRNT